MDFRGADVIGVSQFQREDLDRVFALARALEPYTSGQRFTDVLRGKILGNLFFEASTRTRLSFGAAFKRRHFLPQGRAGAGRIGIFDRIGDGAKLKAGHLLSQRFAGTGSIVRFDRGRHGGKLGGVGGRRSGRRSGRGCRGRNRGLLLRGNHGSNCLRGRSGRRWRR